MIDKVLSAKRALSNVSLIRRFSRTQVLDNREAILGLCECAAGCTPQ